MLSIAAMIAACGPNVSEPEIETAQVCGADGPVQLLAVETPSEPFSGASWASAVVGDRRVAVWYGSLANQEAAFGAYLMDACGGNEVELGARDYPLVVGDAAFVCDPLTGEIRALDVVTAQKGPVLASGFACQVWMRRDDALLLPDLDRGRWGLLRPDGLRPVDVPLDPDFRFYADSGAPYFPPSWGWFSATFERDRSTYTGFFGDVILDLDTGAVRPWPEGVSHIVGLEDGRDLTFVYEPDASGISQVARLESLDAEPVPTSTLDGVEASVYGPDPTPGLLTRDEVVDFDPEQRFPRPALVDAEELVYRLDETRIWQASRERLRVWDLVESRLLLDFAHPGYPCTLQVSEDDVFYLSVAEDNTCGAQELWAIPADGAPPQRLLDHEPEVSFFPLAGAMGLLAPLDDAGPLVWVDRGTGARDVALGRIDGLAWPSHSSLPRTRPGELGTLEYFVHEGDDAGLWIVGTPVD